jgi:catechol 2,3-dioxygenase-like lactoylglutathione lyase family enzyme
MFLEHVNISVTDLERSVAFYRELFGFRVRWQGKSTNGQAVAHVGDDRYYVAMFQADAAGPAPQMDPGRVQINHFGFVVEDLEEMRSRLTRLGVTPHHEADYEPGRRLYFLDPDGIEIELVEYATAPQPI